MFKLFGNKKKGSIDFLVVGLGNPGMKYEDTRHNAGFMAIDSLARKHKTEIRRVRFKGTTGQCEIDGKKILLLKPQTYMNLSGQSVIEAMHFYKLKPHQVIIMFDDIMLDVGMIRIKRKGSDGGQKGVRNIIELSGSEEFPRVKIGIGKKPHPDYDLAAWVTSKFTEKERIFLLPALENAVTSAELIIAGELEEAMGRFN